MESTWIQLVACADALLVAPGCESSASPSPDGSATVTASETPEAPRGMTVRIAGDEAPPAQPALPSRPVTLTVGDEPLQPKGAFAYTLHSAPIPSTASTGSPIRTWA